MEQSLNKTYGFKVVAIEHRLVLISERLLRRAVLQSDDILDHNDKFYFENPIEFSFSACSSYQFSNQICTLGTYLIYSSLVILTVGIILPLSSTMYSAATWNGNVVICL